MASEHEYQYFLKHKLFSFHQMRDVTFLNFHSAPQHTTHFRAYVEAPKGIKIASNEGKGLPTTACSSWSASARK